MYFKKEEDGKIIEYLEEIGMLEKAYEEIVRYYLSQDERIENLKYFCRMNDIELNFED